jgi:colicin import membrane protein
MMVERVRIKQEEFDIHGLIGKIKTHLAAAVRATAEADQQWTNAGRLLKELKAKKPKGTTWVVYVREHFDLRQQRADELIRIADGDTSAEKVRAKTAERMKKHRAEKPMSRDIGDDEKPSKAEKSEARARADQAKAEAATARAKAAEAKANAAKAKANARAEKERHKAEHARMWSSMFNRSKTKSIHSSDRDLLVKSLGMLGSDQFGERDNAARMAETLRRKLGMQWEELIIQASEVRASNSKAA